MPDFFITIPIVWLLEHWPFAIAILAAVIVARRFNKRRDE